VLLEPDTEGRLAATLARFGEGVGAVYVTPRPDHGAGPDGAPSADAAPRASDAPSAIDAARLGRPAAGPLGPGRLVLARPAWGPNIVVLDRPFAAIRNAPP
jgi:hypothetical protein